MIFPKFALRRRRETRTSLTDRIAQALLASKRGNPKRILYVEDDRLYQDSLVAYVQNQFNAVVTPVMRSNDAMQLLDAGQSFDAAILDVRLLNGNGISLYRQIVDRFPKMRVIFLTGYDSHQIRREIHAVGPAAIYPKECICNFTFLDQLLSDLNIQPKPKTA